MQVKAVSYLVPLQPHDSTAIVHRRNIGRNLTDDMDVGADLGLFMRSYHSSPLPVRQALVRARGSLALIAAASNDMELLAVGQNNWCFV